MNVGEDDLFVQQIATRDNVSVVLSPRATCAERIWGGWSWWWHRVKEKQRSHKYYPSGATAPNVAELIIRVLFFASIVVALVYMPWEFKVTALGVMLLRYFFVMFVVVRNARRLGEMGVAPFHAIYDIIEPFLRLAVSLASHRKKEPPWR